MSYILDALKKSEKERAMGNVPTLGSADKYQANRVSVRWLALITVLLLVVIIGFAGWVFWGSRPQTESRTVVEQRSKPVAANVASEDQALPVTKPPETAAMKKIEAGSNKGDPVPVLELDPAVRARLPEFSVNVLSYSDNNSRRFVMIDQNIFKEGEEVKKGIVIEEIRMSEVVFSFEEVQFILKP